MPSETAKQARTMAAAAHDPKFAKRMGIPQTVAREFNQADKGKKLAEAMKRMPKRDV
jgi:ribosome assembly protein YihI (activator of Der GTPase)